MTWPLRQGWFWMLCFLLLFAIVGSFLLIGILVRRPTVILLIIMVLGVIWIISRGYGDWKLKQWPEPEEEQPPPPPPPPQGLEPKVVPGRKHGEDTPTGK